MKTKLMLTLMMCLMLSTAASAQLISGSSEDGNGQGRGKGGPPQEAIDACSTKSEGDSCSFSSRKGDSMAGVCTIKQETLVCFPEGMDEEGAGEGRGSRRGRR